MVSVFPSKPNVSVFYIDFETSGLNPYTDEIIEIGIMTANQRNKMSILIQSSHPITDKITSITGITNDMLKEEGIPIKEAIQSLHHFVKDHTETNQQPWFVAHNGYSFDKLFFDRLYTTHGIRPMTPRPLWVDTLRLAQFSMPHMYSFKLISLCRYFKLADTQDHRALADCQLLAHVFPKIITLTKNKLSITTSKTPHDMLSDINTLLSLEPYQSSTYPTDHSH
jgi:DNA polymerase III alpha subunit (gram-positive type)